MNPSAKRAADPHTYCVPVVREVPRPTPAGLGSAAW